MRALVYDAVRSIVPQRLRWEITSRPWAMSAVQRLFGSDIYSKGYFEQVERSEADSVRTIAHWIFSELHPKHAIDVGCGPGHLMEALHYYRIKTLGLDYADAARASVARKGLPFKKIDLTKRERIPCEPADLAICCEVAEHLDEQYADVLVWHLTGLSDTVFFTAAEPGQSGLNHVNEQSRKYWIDKFAFAGFALDEALTVGAKTTFAEYEVVHYLARPLIFRRAKS